MPKDKENELLPPEEGKRRFDAILRACLFLPPADDEEAQTRDRVRKDWALS